MVFDGHTIAGEVVMPFLTEEYEGFDVNKPMDWQLAEQLVRQNPSLLPTIPGKMKI
jgi:hypothetical protein